MRFETNGLIFIYTNLRGDYRYHVECNVGMEDFEEIQKENLTDGWLGSAVYGFKAGDQYLYCQECGMIVLVNDITWARREYCHSCNIWMDRMPRVGTKNRIIMDNVYFTLADESEDHYFKGHGGAQFLFQRNGDDFVIKSNNVWDGGNVPFRFRSAFPNNAKRISPEDAADKEIRVFSNNDYEVSKL